MDYRLIGNAGLKASSLCLGTGTFGGGNEFFKAWGSTGVEEAKRLIGICLDAGINFFDTAEGYPVPPDIKWVGRTEDIVGRWMKGKNRDAIIDKFTATNITATAATISVNLVTSAGSSGNTNLITKTKTLQASEVYTFPELVGQVLGVGDFISTIAGTASAINIRVSGREVT